MVDRRPEVVRDRVERIADIATADAAEVANRLYHASRAVAIDRFAKIWPKAPSRNPLTRQALQRWYLTVFEQQLAEPIAGATTPTFDSTEAGRLLQVIRDRLHAPDETTMRVITALGRDGQAVAADLAIARAQLVEAALAGRISTLFPRNPSMPELSPGQAIAEQWYARAFHAIIDRNLFAQPTMPISAAEIELVSAAVVAGQPRILLAAGDSVQIQLGAIARKQAAWDWQNETTRERERWLKREGFGPAHVLTPFGRLPAYLQSQLLGLAPGPTAGSLTDYEIPPGSITQQAARMFNQTPIAPATQQDLNAYRLIFTHRIATLPSGILTNLPDIRQVTDALKTLARQNRGARNQMTGFAQQVRLTEEKLDTAIRMHKHGATYRAIAADLGVSPETVSKHVKTHADAETSAAAGKDIPRTQTDDRPNHHPAGHRPEPANDRASRLDAIIQRGRDRTEELNGDPASRSVDDPAPNRTDRPPHRSM